MIFQASINDDKLGLKQCLTSGLPVVQEAGPNERLNGKFLLKVVKMCQPRTVFTNKGRNTAELLPLLVKVLHFKKKI